MIKIILANQKNNGAVYNAKGELIDNTFYGANGVVTGGLGDCVAQVIFSPNGTVAMSNNGSLPWVDTDGSDDVPVDNALWAGNPSSPLYNTNNYTIGWNQGGGVSSNLSWEIRQDTTTWNTAAAGSTSLLTDSVIFEATLQDPGPIAQAQPAVFAAWNITITNTLTGLTDTAVVSITVQHIP